MNQKISIHEVARLAGVSKSTVSRVISERGGPVSAKAEAAVRTAIEKLGYTRNAMAAGLRASRTYTILLVVPDIANPFWSEIARAVQDALEPEGYLVVMGNTDWSEDRERSYLKLSSTGRFDGLIINSVTDRIGLILEVGIPAVLIGERSETTEIDTVGTDTDVAATKALQYLYDMGHRRIAIVTSETGSERYLSRRYSAYSHFLETHGLPENPDLVFTAHLSAEGGERLADSILALPDWKERISAVFCGNDILAISLQNALRCRGVQPGRDLSLIGMDDIPAAALTWPALTTIRKPRGEMGKKASELLLARIKEPSRNPEKHLYPGTLVIRESVADIRMHNHA
ncbi:MAG: LacI family DNA-binding transcriptional regulator [Rectinema sp.]